MAAFEVITEVLSKLRVFFEPNLNLPVEPIDFDLHRSQILSRTIDIHTNRV